MNYVDPNNIYAIRTYDPYLEEMDKVSCRYKDLRYYTQTYSIFGAFYNLLKQIFGNSKERAWHYKFSKENPQY